MRARKKAHKKYTRYYDSNLNKFYWLDNVTQKTSWKASKWLLRQEIPMIKEDVDLFNSQLRIKQLEDQLKQKELEIKAVRKKRYEELEPAVLIDKVINAKNLVRSKNMDEWSTDQLAAWFEEMNMGEHIPYLYKNR
jgi:LPS O-antigen subunit length determinant protein (WzzB/FepE family)